MAIYLRSIPPGGFHGYLRALAARCRGGGVPAPCATCPPVGPLVTDPVLRHLLLWHFANLRGFGSAWRGEEAAGAGCRGGRALGEIWEHAGVASPWVGLGRCWGHLGGRVGLGSCHGVQQGDGGWDGCRRQWGTQRGLGRVRSPRVLALLRWGPRSFCFGGHRCPRPCFQTALITSTLPLPCWGGRAELQLSARAENPIHDPCGILRGCLGTPGPFCPRRHRVPLPPPEISALFYPHHKEPPSMAGSRSVTAG